MSETVLLLLRAGPGDEPTATALHLAERLLARGHRVTVYAAGDAATLSAGDGETATMIAALVRRGLHGGTLDWVVEAAAVARLGCADSQVSGVVGGDGADLWAFARAADVVLSPGSC